jgi:hypothetical protein
MLLKLRSWGSTALKAIGLVTVADKVTGADDKATMIGFAAVGGLIIILLLGRR